MLLNVPGLFVAASSSYADRPMPQFGFLSVARETAMAKNNLACCKPFILDFFSLEVL